MKRFTETLKWNDPWFRKLSPELKNLWSWILDNCDHAGVIEPDYELASFQIGFEYPIDTLSKFGERVRKMDGKKWLIVKFIEFQYGELSDKCKGHNPVFASLSKHGLKLIVGANGKKNTVQQNKGMDTLPHTPQDRTGQGQDKDKQGVKGENNLEIFAAVESRIGALFNRPSGHRSDYFEQSAISEISRRKDVLLEIAELELFHAKPENFFPQSIKKLLSTWQDTLDRARTHETRKKNHGNNSKSNSQSVDRAIGTTNEGKAKNYRGIKSAGMGAMVKVQDV